MVYHISQGGCSQNHVSIASMYSFGISCCARHDTTILLSTILYFSKNMLVFNNSLD